MLPCKILYNADYNYDLNNKYLKILATISHLRGPMLGSSQCSFSGSMFHFLSLFQVTSLNKMINRLQSIYTP